MAAASTTASDEQLVATIRAGSDTALEALFRRYRDRLTSYVRGLVPDYARAEDIVQETFISALRSMRSSDREIIFKPWIYQIARNACIDQIRRQRRAEEVSIDSDDFNMHDEGRLSETAPSTERRVSQREQMDVLRQALGGLPESQHAAIVLRELEGRSYEEIAQRMEVSPSAVESMLFRARRGLRDEYRDITTGARCRRMKGVIAAISEGLGGPRDRRGLERHVRHCLGCRQEAVAMGLAELVRESDRRSRVRRALDRAAALLPLPPLGWHRGGGSELSIVDRLGGRAQVAVSNFGAVGPASGEAASALPKAVAVLVAAALIGGGGIVGRESGSGIAATPAPGAALDSAAAHDDRAVSGDTRSASSGTSTASSGSVSQAYESLGTPLPQPFLSTPNYVSVVRGPITSGEILPSGEFVSSESVAPLLSDQLIDSTALAEPGRSDPVQVRKLSQKLADRGVSQSEPVGKVKELSGRVKELPRGLTKRDRPLPPNNPYSRSISVPGATSTPVDPSPPARPSDESGGGIVEDVLPTVDQPSLPTP